MALIGPITILIDACVCDIIEYLREMNVWDYFML